MKLHGVPLSNFYNMAKHALLEKGAPFEEVVTAPSQEPDFLAISPMGKVPVLETDDGPLTEAPAIIEYLDMKYPDNPLYPADPYARARVIQLMRIVELYVEAPIHPLVGTIFGRDVPDHVIAAARPGAEKGLAALARLAKFSPYIAGPTFTAADIVAFHGFTLARILAKQVLDWDLMATVPALESWYDTVGKRETTQRILADMEKAQQS